MRARQSLTTQFCPFGMKAVINNSKQIGVATLKKKNTYENRLWPIANPEFKASILKYLGAHKNVWIAPPSKGSYLPKSLRPCLGIYLMCLSFLYQNPRFYHPWFYPHFQKLVSTNWSKMLNRTRFFPDLSLVTVRTSDP